MSKFNKEQSGVGKPISSSSSSKTSLRELSEFHPRLSMRAAVSNKIDDEALNLIQKHQNEQMSSPIISPILSTTSSESVQEPDLMQNLTRYVGPDGLINEFADLKEYAELMQCEASSSHQLLLLKIILATLKSKEDFSSKLIDCEGFMIVLGLWLSSVEQDKLLDSILIEKILEVLSILSFTVDLLVKYKFGRVIKKITQQKSLLKMKTNNYELASKLFGEWSELANKPEIPSVPRRKSEDSATEIELPSISVSSSPEKCTPVIPKTALKRGASEVESEETKKTKIVLKKSVKFPDNEEDLCRIILFERAPEEFEYLSDGSASRDSYLHADKGEALAAFEHPNDSDESIDSIGFVMKPWKQLEIINGVPSDRPEGIDCEEKIIQHQRERSVLSVNYYSINDVPPVPSETEVDEMSMDEQPSITNIPIRSNETIVKHSFNFKTTPILQSLEISSLFTPDMNNFIAYSTSKYNDLLNPFSNGKSSTIDLNNSYKSNTPIPPRIDSSWNAYRPSATTQPMTESPVPSSGYSSKSICRHYRPGKARSCWQGSNCKFLHQD